MSESRISTAQVRRIALWIAAAAVLAHLGLSAGGVWSFDAINYDDPQVMELVKQSSVSDLLTTSNRPGHAMRVDDPGKAGGAILGKAMTGLREGRGLVLVLVSLQ